jgi:signal transduction histidine kinase/molybdopterin converting factor small subunit
MEDLYRRLFEALPCYVSIQDAEYRLVATNEMYRRDFDVRPGAFCYEVYKGRTEKCPECPVEKTFLDGRTHSSEEIVRLRGGEDAHVIVYTAPIRDGGGKIEAVVEISADITNVKRLQRKYLTLFEEAPCYISVQNRDLRIVEANREHGRAFGPGIGEYCYKVYKHRTEPCIPCAVASTFHDGRIRTHEEVVTDRHGKRINVLVHTAPIPNAAGEIDSVMEMSTDITSLRQLQSQLTSVGLIVSSVSHGIKGLLSGLDGGIYLMETGFKDDNMDRLKQGWDMVQRKVDRIRSMVMNILYYAKDREIYWQPIDIEEITESVRDVLESRAEAHGVELRASAEEGVFEGDQHSIHSLLVNILENSIDACRLGGEGPPRVVSMTARLDGDSAIFEIEDNGVGMDRETKEKAFSMFFSSKGAAGTGLGLFIANKIVQNHGGSIEIDSAPGVGTRFTVRLPKERPDSPPRRADAEAPPLGLGAD